MSPLLFCRSLRCVCLVLCAAMLTSATLAQITTSGSATTELPPAPQASQTATAELASVERLLHRGQNDEALRAADQLAAQKPDTPGLERVRGEVLYALGRFGDAERAFALAAQRDASDKAAVQLRGLSLFRLGRPAEAIPYLEAAHSWTSDTTVDPTYVLALCYIDSRRYDDARHAFAAQYGFPADSASAHLLLARLLLRREFVPVAQEEARKALELQPDLPMAHLLLGEIALAGEHLDEAVREFEQEQRRNPLLGSIYDRLGDAYSRRGDLQQAQQALQRALLLEPATTAPYILLGKVLLRRQDPVSAAGYLERAERMDPANYMTHNLLGQAYRGLGRTDASRRELELAQKLQADAAPKLDGPRRE